MHLTCGNEPKLPSQACRTGRGSRGKVPRALPGRLTVQLRSSAGSLFLAGRTHVALDSAMRTAAAGAGHPSAVPAIDARRRGRAGAHLCRAGLLRAPRANSKGQEGKGDRQDSHDELRSELNSLQQCAAGTGGWQSILGIFRDRYDSGSVEIFRNATEARRAKWNTCPHRLRRALTTGQPGSR
jgi:hypothetical protein